MFDGLPIIHTGVMHSPHAGPIGDDEYTSHEFVLTRESDGTIRGYWALTAVGMYQEFNRTFDSEEDFERFLADEGYTDIIASV